MAHIIPVLEIIVIYLTTENSKNIYFMKITVRVLDSETELYLMRILMYGFLWQFFGYVL